MDLKKKLNYHYRYFDFSKISPDPLEFPHRYTEEKDIEISAFISSVFAYGNVNQIIATLEKVHKAMGKSPSKFIEKYDIEKGQKKFANIKHRFYTSDDIVLLFLALHRAYKHYGSLNYLFILYHFDGDDDLKFSVKRFSENMINLAVGRGEVSNGLKFMFPDPSKGSACKRMNLFLRWMVRKDELDFGLWKEIKPSQLLIPVDTHVAQVCKKLRLTHVKNVSWKMAEDITKKLKKIDPKDPVKYDFAICHIGMRKMKF